MCVWIIGRVKLILNVSCVFCGYFPIFEPFTKVLTSLFSRNICCTNALLFYRQFSRVIKAPLPRSTVFWRTRKTHKRPFFSPILESPSKTQIGAKIKILLENINIDVFLPCLLGSLDFPEEIWLGNLKSWIPWKSDWSLRRKPMKEARWASQNPKVGTRPLSCFGFANE